MIFDEERNLVKILEFFQICTNELLDIGHTGTVVYLHKTCWSVKHDHFCHKKKHSATGNIILVISLLGDSSTRDSQKSY